MLAEHLLTLKKKEKNWTRLLEHNATICTCVCLSSVCLLYLWRGVLRGKQVQCYTF